MNGAKSRQTKKAEWTGKHRGPREGTKDRIKHLGNEQESQPMCENEANSQKVRGEKTQKQGKCEAGVLGVFSTRRQSRHGIGHVVWVLMAGPRERKVCRVFLWECPSDFHLAGKRARESEESSKPASALGASMFRRHEGRSHSKEGANGLPHSPGRVRSFTPQRPADLVPLVLGR